MRACTEGWVLFVDDDDTLFDKDTLLKLVQHLDDEDTLVIHRFQFEDGRQVPPDLLFERRQLALHGIGTGCFTFHSKWRNYVRWDCRTS
jgi:GT2 family glycosyltransferase